MFSRIGGVRHPDRLTDRTHTASIYSSRTFPHTSALDARVTSIFTLTCTDQDSWQYPPAVSRLNNAHLYMVTPYPSPEMLRIEYDRHEAEILGRSLMRSFQAAGSLAIHPAMISVHRRQMVWPKYRQPLPLSSSHISMFSPFTLGFSLGDESYTLSLLINPLFGFVIQSRMSGLRRSHILDLVIPVMRRNVTLT